MSGCSGSILIKSITVNIDFDVLSIDISIDIFIEISIDFTCDVLLI